MSLTQHICRDFWKTWRKKFRKTYSTDIINGSHHSAVVAQAFALFAKFSTLQSIPHVQNHLLIHQTFRTRTTLPAAISVETMLTQVKNREGK